MRPEFRYFKCSLEVEPIKSLKKEWDDLREERDKKLDAIFDTIPFYEFWRGSDNRIFGIVCNAMGRLDVVKDTPQYQVWLAWKEEQRKGVKLC